MSARRARFGRSSARAADEELPPPPRRTAGARAPADPHRARGPHRPPDPSGVRRMPFAPKVPVVWRAPRTGVLRERPSMTRENVEFSAPPRTGGDGTSAAGSTPADARRRRLAAGAPSRPFPTVRPAPWRELSRRRTVRDGEPPDLGMKVAHRHRIDLGSLRGSPCSLGADRSHGEVFTCRDRGTRGLQPSGTGSSRQRGPGAASRGRCGRSNPARRRSGGSDGPEPTAVPGTTARPASSARSCGACARSAVSCAWSATSSRGPRPGSHGTRPARRGLRDRDRDREPGRASRAVDGEAIGMPRGGLPGSAALHPTGPSPMRRRAGGSPRSAQRPSGPVARRGATQTRRMKGPTLAAGGSMSR